MKQPAAFRASYSDLKLIKTRQCVQIVFELPLADFDAAYELLGGLPDNSKERWFAIAALNGDHPTKPRDWKELQPAQQAGIRSNDKLFIEFLKEEYSDVWHEQGDGAACIRDICEVHSRTELGTNQAKRVLWHQLDTQFQAWMVKERINA